MKALNILLGNREELLNRFLESFIREVCGGVPVRCVRAARVDEFIGQACAQEFALAIFIPPGNLLPDPHQPPDRTPLEESIRIIETIKASRPGPLIVFSAWSEHQQALLQAGADCFLGLPVEPDHLLRVLARFLYPRLNRRASKDASESLELEMVESAAA